MQLRDYTFLGTTRSLCPHCRRLVDAKIIREGRYDVIEERARQYLAVIARARADMKTAALLKTPS